MADRRWDRIQRIFEDALKRKADERDAFLAEACGDDAELRREVESLLKHHHEASTGFMEPAPEDRAKAAVRVLQPPEKDPLIGQRVGGYRIKSVIGFGGMGTVYLAQQEHPRRTVALKVMKQGIASRSALRRFEFESQILARLRHPGIAQVHEAGTHDDGSGGVPYFAMEYIPNAKTIIDYAREKKLSTKERLELFAKVCDAVHHGHQKGIIHRDLKPANILVDSSGEPKVIDFGVARSTDSDMAVTTLQTDVGQLIGTLQYMSPEQCEADPNDLDTRSDVYALGVVLFELLCEQLPYDVTKVAVFEAARVVREEQPAKPSTINRTLRGDVETIALKALQKERERRYKSAEALGDDIHKYLSDEPIEARPPSAIYQIRMFARRNRTVFSAMVAVGAVLAIATIVSVGLLIRTNTAKNEANLQTDNANEINNFLTDDLLAAVAPSAEAGKGKDVLMRDVLDVASQKIGKASRPEGRFANKPLIESSIRATLGETYRLLGEYTNAEPHLARARQLRLRELGEEHPDTLSSLSCLANLYHSQGRYDEAEPLFVKTLKISKRVLGEAHPDTLSCMNNLAVLYADRGRHNEAESLYVAVLEMKTRVLGEEHPSSLISMCNLAALYSDQGRYDESEPLHIRVLEIRRRILGDGHPDTLTSMHNLARLYDNQIRYDEAEPLHRKTVEIGKRLFGLEQPEVLICMHDLTKLYINQGRYDDAEPLGLECYECNFNLYGEQHPETIGAVNLLIDLYSARHEAESDKGYAAKAEEWRAKLSQPEE